MHWITQLTSALDPGCSAYFDFCRSVQNAMFILDEGDKKRVTAFLETIGQTFEQHFADDPQWILRHVRRTIPQPAVLEQRVMEVMKQFDEVIDPTSNSPLFLKGFDWILDNAMV